MKIKQWLFGSLAAVLMLSCCACSAKTKPETAAQVAEKMQTALQETPCSYAQLTMDMTMAIASEENGTLEVTTKTTNDIKVTQEPVSGYTAVTAEVECGGEKSQSVTESYSVVEDDELVSYIHSGGVWMKVANGQRPEDFARFATSVSMDASNISIDESLTEYNGKEAICLTTHITGEALQTALGEMLEGIVQQVSASGETANTVDYSAMSCNACIYLDRETYLPIAEEFTFSGMSEAMNALYAQSGMTANVSGCTASAMFLSYEAQNEAVLPEGAREKAEAWARLLSGEPDNGDGTFTIREGAALIDIVAPEGFKVVDKDYDHVYFKREDNREIHYTAVHGTAEYLASKIEQQLADYGDLPKSISREQMTLDGETLSFEADVLGIVWQSYEEGRIYAHSMLSSDGDAGYYIFIEVVDGYNNGLGGIKNADITPEELMTYLNSATPSDLMNE